jgi:hypothetical protein
VVLLVAAASVVGMAVWVARPDSAAGAWEPTGPVREITADPGVVLDQVLAVPADPGGCPGFTVPAPAASRYPPSRGEDGGSEAAIPLGSEAHVMVVCMGRSAEVGFPPDADPEEFEASGLELLRIEAVRSAHGEGPAITSRIGRMLLTDYYVERDGWVHAVGYLRPEEVGDTYLPVVETMLASWSWD